MCGQAPSTARSLWANVHASQQAGVVSGCPQHPWAQFSGKEGSSLPWSQTRALRPRGGAEPVTGGFLNDCKINILVEDKLRCSEVFFFF